MNKSRNNKIIFFALPISILVMTGATYLGTVLFGPYQALLVSVIFFLISTVAHLSANRDYKLYWLSTFFNACASGLCVASYYSLSNLTVPLIVAFAATVPCLILLGATCVTLQFLPKQDVVILTLAWVAAFFLTLFSIMLWITSLPLEGSLCFFPSIFTVCFAAAFYFARNKSNTVLQNISFGSFGALIALFLLIVSIESNGSAFDAFDSQQTTKKKN